MYLLELLADGVHCGVCEELVFPMQNPACIVRDMTVGRLDDGRTHVSHTPTGILVHVCGEEFTVMAEVEQLTAAIGYLL